MLNQVVIIGRLMKVIDLGEGNGAIISIKNTRPFKNDEGIYEDDIIDVKIFDGIKNSLVEYCQQGDMVGVKGRVSIIEEDEKKIMEIIGERITFLSAKKEANNE